MSTCMQCGAGASQSCKHREVAPRRVPNDGAIPILTATDSIRQRASNLRDQLPPERLAALRLEQRIDVYVALRRAANTLYSITKELDSLILAEAGKSRGFVDSRGFPLEVKRKFETELLNEDEFSAWAADRGVNPFETKVALTREAKDAVKRATVEDGEKVPGVSAGMGNPFLSLGKVS